MRRTLALLLTLPLVPLGLSATPAQATAKVALKTVARLDTPVAMAFRKGDKSPWVAQQGGVVKRLDGSSTQTKLDVSNQIEVGGELGLLGLAFSKDGRHLYVDVTRKPDNTTAVWDYTLSPHGKVLTSTRRTVLEQPQPYPNHKGGNLLIGPDGYLYVGFGDGGSAGDPGRRAQDPSTWLGKILRIDPTHHTATRGYSVPQDNPFVGRKGWKPEIWILGVRNPWRFEFDKSNGDLWIGDVGQDKLEEVDHLKATKGQGAGKGANLGWSAYEGTAVYNADQVSKATHAVKPVLTYGHNPRCAITGGFVYRGTKIPALKGQYVFSDFCTGGIFTLHGTLLTDPPSVSSLGQGPDGELYVLSLDGTVSKVVKG